MTQMEAEVYIPASTETVWELVSDVHRLPEWVTNVEQILSVSDVPVKVGTIYRDRVNVAGLWRPVREWRITEFTPPRWQVHEGKWPGIGKAVISMSLEPLGTSTQFKLTEAFHWHWYLKPLAWLLLEGLFLRRTLQAELRRHVENAKALLRRSSSRVL